LVGVPGGWISWAFTSHTSHTIVVRAQDASGLFADQSFTTLDIRINYLRPITLETGEVAAHGSVIQSGRRVAYVEAKLVDGAGKLLAHGTGSLLIFERQSSKGSPT